MRKIRIRKKDLNLTGGEVWCSFCKEIHDRAQLKILSGNQPWHGKFCNDSIPVPVKIQHGGLDVELRDGEEHPEEIALRAVESGFWEIDKGKKKAKGKAEK